MECGFEAEDGDGLEERARLVSYMHPLCLTRMVALPPWLAPFLHAQIRDIS